MPPQLALPYDGRRAVDADWDVLRELLREAVDFIGVKQVAYDLDVAPSSLVQALSGADRHHIRAEWIPYLIRRAPNDRIVEHLADLRKLEVQPAKPATPEEELASLRRALVDSLGPELVESITARAKRYRR